MKKLFAGKPKSSKPTATSNATHDDARLSNTGEPAPRLISSVAAPNSPPSPDLLGSHHPHRTQPTSVATRDLLHKEQPKSDREQGSRRSTDENWEVIHPSDVMHDGEGLPNPHSPSPVPTRSGSLTILPPGASPPAPSPLIPPRSTSPFGPSTTNSSPVHQAQPSPVTTSPHTLRKKPPIKEVNHVAKDTVGIAGAASILRALDPNKRRHSELFFQQGRNSSAESLQRPPSIRSENDRDSTELEREREWRERDREIRESISRERTFHAVPAPELGEEKKRDRFHLRTVTDIEGSRERERSRERDGERKEDKRSQWGAIFSAKDREREKDRDETPTEQLTRMIGYLTATATEDWPLVLEVCERASANEANAKVAAKALRREFKYAEPTAQLSAARLWAIILRNSSEVFLAQTTSRKFLETLEEVLNSSRTSPVVRERLLDIIGAAAYASPSKDGKDHAFKALWRKYKPDGKPDEGLPFESDDLMFNPSALRANVENGQLWPSKGQPTTRQSNRNRVISVEEDIRRLFQECKIGRGNGALLTQALAFAEPEDLNEKEIIKEFYTKCRASQELIFAQIPWASAGAERSRQESQRGTPKAGNEPPLPLPVTREERLLADLLKANEELTDALRLYSDLERVGQERALEREAEKRSRIETRINRSMSPPVIMEEGQHPDRLIPSSLAASSRSPSPASQQTRSANSSPPELPHTLTTSFPPSIPLDAHPPTSIQSTYTTPPVPISQAPSLSGTLAPPIRVTHGPRSPTGPHSRSRSPSPTRSNPGSNVQSRSHSRTSSLGFNSGAARPAMAPRLQLDQVNSALSNVPAVGTDEVLKTPIKPSAKALGKRRVVEAEEPTDRFDPDDTYYAEGVQPVSRANEPEETSSPVGPHGRRELTYVYDAAAERTEEWLRGSTHADLVNGVR